MRKPLLLLTCGLLFVSCIDKDYDLDNVETGNTAIGDATTVFTIPLASIKVGLSEIKGNGSDIKSFFDEADTWLPTQLPDGAKTVDIPRLKIEPAYLTQLLDGLTDQMMTDDEKMDDVSQCIYDQYRDDFVIPGLTGDEDPQTYKALFKEVFRLSTEGIRDQIVGQIKQTASAYLTGLDKIEPLKYDIGKIDIGSDVVKMLTSNNDGKETPLELFGEIKSLLPADIQLRPAFAQTAVHFEVEVTPNGQNEFDEVQVSKADFEKIVAGAVIDIPIALSAYHPRSFSQQDEQIVIRLSVRKTGGLNLDL